MIARLARLKDAVVAPVVAAEATSFLEKILRRRSAVSKGLADQACEEAEEAHLGRAPGFDGASGEYLGLLSGMPKSKRASYKAIAKKDGLEKAISVMKTAQGK